LLAFAVLLPACILLILDRKAGIELLHSSGWCLRSPAANTRRVGAEWHHHSGFLAIAERSFALRILPSVGIVLPNDAAGICPQAVVRSSRDDRLHDRHRIPELHGLGPPHVCERHEPVLGESVLWFQPLSFTIPATILNAPAHRHGLWGQDAVHNARAFLPRFTFSVFISGGISGFFLAQPSLDTYLHAT